MNLEDAPKVIYQGLMGAQDGIPLFAQFLFMKAGLKNGEYTAKDFSDKLMAFDTSSLTNADLREEIEGYRMGVITFAEAGTGVKIEGFQPEQGIEDIIKMSYR